MYDHLPDADLTHHIHVGAPAERELATEELRRRHLPAVLSYARIVGRDDNAAEDLAAQAFTQALQERHGLGDIAWRHHLLLLVQCVALPWAAGDRRSELAPGFGVRADEIRQMLPERPAPQDLEQVSLLLRGFRRLPTRSQTLLWHRIVEEDPDETVAALLGLVTGSVPALVEQAQDKLRISFIRAALENGSQECAGFVRIIEAVARHSDRRNADLERHLDQCPGCSQVLGQLREMIESYRTVLVEGLFVWGGAAYISLRPKIGLTITAFPTPGPVTSRTAADAPTPRHRTGRSRTRARSRPLRALGAAFLTIAVAGAAAALVINTVNGSGTSDDRAAEPPDSQTTTTVTATPTPSDTESAPPPPDEADSYRQVVNIESRLCLDVEDGQLVQGADTVLAKCRKKAKTQKWYLDDDALFRNFADSGFCLDPRGSTNKGTGVRKCDAFDEDAGPEKDLRFTLLSEGSIRPFIALDFALTPRDDSAGSAVRLERANEPTDDEQRWRTGAKVSGPTPASAPYSYPSSFPYSSPSASLVTPGPTPGLTLGRRP